ncbi:MAG: aspartate kinase, partial [Nitrosopumilus sp.]|nr:aspartate kinase [Nitrosopumilus sp.]
MTNLIIAKFGGSAIGPDGISIPQIIERINNLKKDSRVITVFSAPLTLHNQKKRSLTDVVLEQGKNAENGIRPSLDVVKTAYQKILQMVSDDNRKKCGDVIEIHLKKAQVALDDAFENKEFADETRSKALAFSGEILMAHVMNYILRSNQIKTDAVEFDNWPIITDNNIESTNFLRTESNERMGGILNLVENNEVVTIGGFIGKTVDGITTTYERGGSDRTAADLGILFHKKYDASIDFEKDSSVVS